MWTHPTYAARFEYWMEMAGQDCVELNSGAFTIRGQILGANSVGYYCLSEGMTFAYAYLAKSRGYADEAKAFVGISLSTTRKLTYVRCSSTNTSPMYVMVCGRTLKFILALSKYAILLPTL